MRHAVRIAQEGRHRRQGHSSRQHRFLDCPMPDQIVGAGQCRVAVQPVAFSSALWSKSEHWKAPLTFAYKDRGMTRTRMCEAQKLELAQPWRRMKVRFGSRRERRR